jgi:crotonobetainyl-CoA:carnitine CoA-transferase CaiB-like acyl-CoA transferase
MLALFYRERTNIGQFVQTSQLQTAINVLLMFCHGPHLLFSDEEHRTIPHEGAIRNISREEVTNALTNMYRCKDNKWIYFGAYFDHHWLNIAKAICKPELFEDPRFVSYEKRTENNKELISILNEVIAQKEYAEWVKIFRESGGVPFSPINTPDSLALDEQVLANDYLCNFDHPILGRIKMFGMPCTLSETPGAITSAAPVFGQHTEEILLELDYSWEEIEKLRSEKVI